MLIFPLSLLLYGLYSRLIYRCYVIRQGWLLSYSTSLLFWVLFSCDELQFSAVLLLLLSLWLVSGLALNVNPTNPNRNSKW